MKNNSWQYPFTTLDDKRFDSNKDGKLDTFETIFRDAHINEMNKKAEQYAKERQRKSVNSFESMNINNIDSSDEPGCLLYSIIFLLAVAFIVLILKNL